MNDSNVNVYALDRWLDTMRSPIGYGGPVAHWWQQSLMFCGAGFDWRYEGIITGYLALWQRTGAQTWLDKACRAGDDLLKAQMENGNFPNSAFESNPSTAGTPHEVACDVGLLRLGEALQHHNAEAAEPYVRCAERNLQSFYIEQLWDAKQKRFRDGVGTDTFVPNKAATACEAFFLWAKLRQREDLVEQYVLPTLNHILDHQLQATGKLHGAIAQNSLNQRRVDKFFPIYIARCVAALLQGYEWTKDERWVAGAQAAIAFIVRWVQVDGSIPTVVYQDGSINSGHVWRAALGDVLRAAQLLRSYHFTASTDPIDELFCNSQDSSGAFQTASGFAAQAGGRIPALPDVRDVLHVVGWNDKAFRYLAEFGDLLAPDGANSAFEQACTFRGQRVQFRETSTLLTISAQSKLIYRWQKGSPYPDIAAPDFWLR